MASFVGIDFGTTNSAIGLVDGAGRPRLARFPGAAATEPSPTWRSVLYFAPGAPRGVDGVAAGARAIAGYIDNEGEGRLIQSVKSHLASSLFSRTQIMGRSWRLEELIAAFLTQARRAVTDELGTRVVVGRPVRYWGAETDEDDARAVSRMTEAVQLAGFDEVVFEYEPVAAAARYAAGLDHDELVVIADFGGGTSDFSLLRVGPGVAPGDPSAILATGGLGIGGDTFDGRIVDAVIAPLLGKGTVYRDEFGAEMTVPSWLYSRLRRWHHLSFLKSPKTMRLLQRIHAGSVANAEIGRLLSVVEDDLGLPLHQSIERAKVELSKRTDSTLTFNKGRVEFSRAISRTSFDSWVEPELTAIDGVVDELLLGAGVPISEVDRVFTTGGSSFVPAVRQRLAAKFGVDRLVGGGELTAVAWGLASRARERFA